GRRSRPCGCGTSLGRCATCRRAGNAPGSCRTATSAHHPTRCACAPPPPPTWRLVLRPGFVKCTLGARPVETGLSGTWAGQALGVLTCPDGVERTTGLEPATLTLAR